VPPIDRLHDPLHGPVHPIERLRHRAANIDDEDHAVCLALVVDFVVPTVVEQNPLALLPGINLFFEPDRGRVLLRYDQSEVIAKVAALRPFMMRD